MSDGRADAAVLARLQERYAREGYTFLADPPRRLLPTFLGDFRPDAVALHGNGGVVIEIKRGRQNRNRLPFREIARRVRANPDWRFEVFYTDDVQEFGSASPERIEAVVREVDELAASGHASAALV